MGQWIVSLIDCDVCVIGAGSGGLTVAAGAAKLGARVVLIEKGAMGGDCLNTGCVPSKALLAAAAHASALRRAPEFGVHAGGVGVDWCGVRAHVREVIAQIAPNDSVERFEDMGVRILCAAACFLDRRRVQAGTDVVRAKYFVIATGARPFVPKIDGLEQVPYLTHETIFFHDRPIEHLIVIGGGPIGVEMAQAHRRLGAQVTLLETGRVLAREDPELVAMVADCLGHEGVKIHVACRRLRLRSLAHGRIEATFETDEGMHSIHGTEILVATGRRPNSSGLHLDRAAVRCSDRGIEVDEHMRTSNRRIFAVGDVTGGLQFTHLAAYQAGIVLRNMLFKWPARARAPVPWVVFTDPELAHVGLRESDARRLGRTVRVLRWPMEENDRAQTERRPEGLLKVIVSPTGNVLGASMVARHAGELIQPWILAVQKQLNIRDMASMVVPYPTLGEINVRVAGEFFRVRLFSPRVRRLVRLLLRFTP